MATTQYIIHNLYRDSVSLMQLSDKIARMPGIRQASAIMGTENNIALLVEGGLLKQAIAPTPNDLLLVIEGDDPQAVQAAIAQAETLLRQKPALSGEGVARAIAPRSVEMGLAESPAANLALISTPGEYAAAEALKALRLGLHVMIFSSSVSLEDEVMLKQYAESHDLLVMGPDCGTAILNGVPLGFANVVRRGNIGIVAASGTGLQEVSSLIHWHGGGISQAIGTGSHDLHEKVGGITMRQGIAALAADSATKVIALISKPPSAEVAKTILEEAARSKKPIVVDFIGADSSGIKGVHAARTLEEAALIAVALAEGQAAPKLTTELPDELTKLANELAGSLSGGQKYIRGLFSGGTLCYETLLLFGELIGGAYSNTPLKPEHRLSDVWKSQGHTAVDLGDEHFTRGRPHPMIDFRLRNERMIQEASDPETAVILLDVVLGYGSNPDPAAELAPAIKEAVSIAGKAKRKLVFIASVCGTDADPQNLRQQEVALREAGVHLAGSNAQAARLAAAVAMKIGG